MATAKTTLNRPRGPALIPPQTPPGTTTQPPTHATFCAPLFIFVLKDMIRYHHGNDPIGMDGVIIAEYSFEIREGFLPSSSSKHIRFHISISTTITGLQRNVYKIFVGNNIATRRKFIPLHVDIGVGQRCHAAFDQLSRVSTLYEWKSN